MTIVQDGFKDRLDAVREARRRRDFTAFRHRVVSTKNGFAVVHDIRPRSINKSGCSTVW